MTESNQTPPRAVAELTALARQIDGQLSDETAGRQQIAEDASARIKDIAHWLRGAAKPGHDQEAEQARVEQAREFIEDARGRDLQDMPASVLSRLAAELLRHASWLLAVIDDDPDLVDASLRIRAADQQAELTAAERLGCGGRLPEDGGVRRHGDPGPGNRRRPPDLAESPAR